LKKQKLSQKKKTEITGNSDDVVQDTFFLSFIGELVELTGSFRHEDKVTDISLIGYILDITPEYYFLGNNPDEVCKAIKRESVVYIEILNPEDQFISILEDMEVPKNEQEKN
jgi:hypothetical protein